MDADTDILDELRAIMYERVPCSGCPLRLLCQLTGLACQRYLSYVRGARPGVWATYARVPRPKYARLLTVEPPRLSPDTTAAARERGAQCRLAALERDRELIGAVVAGREVVRIEPRTANANRAVLRCGQCGAEARRYTVEQVRRGDPPPCRCHRSDRYREAARREWLGREVAGWRVADVTARARKLQLTLECMDCAHRRTVQAAYIRRGGGLAPCACCAARGEA